MTEEQQDALSPDRFIRELWATAPGDWWAEFFLIQYRPTEKNPDAKAVRVLLYTVDQVRKDWESVWRYLQSANRTEVFNVHPAVNPRFQKPKKRGKNSDVSHFTAAWVDVDFHENEESVKKAFWVAVEMFVKAGLPPSIIVESGHGLHVYWLYDKLYPAKDAERICAGIQDAFKVADSNSDPSRVLRMPGTVNLKDAKRPTMCRVIQATYVRYPIEKFSDYAVEPTKSEQALEDEAVERKNQEILKRLGKSRNKEIEEIKKGVPESGGTLGGRNQAATKYTGWLFSQGLTADKVRELILEWNKLNSPPLPDEEIATVVGSITKAEAENHPGGRKKKGSDDDERSDILAALQLKVKYGDQMMYCEPMKGWLIWDETRWTEDRRNVAFGRSTDIAAAAGIKRHRADRISATLRVAQPMLSVVPEDLNKDPWVLNCTNGTLNLQDMSWKKHDPKDMLTHLCPTAYEPDAKAPLWEKFLLEIMGGSQELVTYLQRLAGYCLTGIIREHVLPIAYGTGSNGKSTFLGTLRKVLGNDYAAEAAPDILMTKDKSSHPTERADLAGKRMVTTIEVEDGRRLAENFVKQLTGGDELKVRRMRENFWTLKPTWKIFLATNNKPEVKGMDFGLWRRIKLIPFSVTIPEAGMDRTLPEKLAQEASGILSWAVRGCVEWKASGLNDPPAVHEATTEYKADTDVMGKFFSDCCVILPGLRAQGGQLYEIFRNWFETEVGTEPMNGTVFGRRLTEYGFRVEKVGGKKWRLGIGIGELSCSTSKLNQF